MSYKGKWYGCEVKIADRYYPSSKRCSSCGQLKPDLALSERMYCCAYCGLEIDRDLNAALNLEQLLSMSSELPRVPREVTPVESMEALVSGNAR